MTRRPKTRQSNTRLRITPREVPLPTVSACLRHAGETFVDRLPLLLLLGLIVAAIWAAGGSLTRFHGPIGILGIAWGCFLTTPAHWAFQAVCLRAVRDDPSDVEALLRAEGHYREVVIAGVLVSLMVIGGLFFFVLPGVYFYVRTRFVPYLVVADGLDAVSAVRESFHLTRGLGVPILAISAIGFLSSCVGLLFFGVGLVPALITWDLSLASLFHASVESGAPIEWDELDEILGHTEAA